MNEWDLVWLLLPLLGLVWAPRSWTPGELVTASSLNTIRDHLNALRATQATTLTGTQNDFALDGPFVYLKCSNTSRLVLTGIQADGGNVDGARITIEALDREVTLNHEDTGSTSANRISTPDGEPVRIRAGSGESRAVLFYDSTLNRWRLEIVESCLSSPSTRSFVVEEEFLGENITSDEIGEHGWNFSTTGSASVASFAGVAASQQHPGIIGLNTGATSGSVVRLSIRRWAYVDWDECAFIVRPRNNITARIHVGMADATALDSMNEDHDGAFFSYDSAQSANWRTITRNGGSKTATDSGVAVSAATWYVLEIRKDGTDVLFFIDGALVATHTTNLPDDSDNQGAKFGIVTTDTNNGNLDCDFFRVRGFRGIRV